MPDRLSLCEGLGKVHRRNATDASRSARVRSVNYRPTPPARLHSTLEQLRLEGAIFFRSELTKSHAVESTPLAIADPLHPGAERASIAYALEESAPSKMSPRPLSTRLPEFVLIEVLRLYRPEDLLTTSDLGTVTIARRVGYESEEAFSRALKRSRGLAPSHRRATRSTSEIRT